MFVQHYVAGTHDLCVNTGGNGLEKYADEAEEEEETWKQQVAREQPMQGRCKPSTQESGL